MAAVALLDALEAFLTTTPDLTPAPNSVGVLEPANNAELPAVVLSLSALVSAGPGLGQRAEVIEGGALQWTSLIDLANPVLPENESLTLISNDRRRLTLPHGDLVESDGQGSRLSADDIQVSLDGTPFAVVAGAPASGEVDPSAAEGRLTFGDPLPATGILRATYFLGQWERRVEPIAGTLDLAVVAAGAADVRDLSNAVLAAFARAPETVRGLRRLAMTGIGPVTPFTATGLNARVRRMHWSLDYEHVVDRPESSGGLIRGVHLRSRTDDAPYEEETIR
jgi:hypothetical protein